MTSYLCQMRWGILVLWIYIIWYLVMVAQYFEPDPALWANSLGLCLIVGLALVLATGPITKQRLKTQYWQVFRLFLCPFCVSSFSALTKEKGFFLILSPEPGKNLLALSCCAVFLVMVVAIKRLKAPRTI
ncbi:MAG: hypothetical protein V7752_20105 [Halopseudomonas sp.]